MKKRWKLQVAAVTVAAALLLPAGAYAMEDTNMMDKMDMTDTMMVPLRTTAESLDYSVHWDAKTNSVTMTYQGMDDSLAMRMIVLSLKTGAIQINGMDAMGMYMVKVEMGKSYVDNMFVDKVLKGMM